MKSSLDCWLWHTYTYLLESVLDLANCCEGCFLHQGKNSSVIHHSCFPWSSGSFGLVLLSSPVRSFFLRMFQTVVLATPNVFAISLMGLFCFFSLMMACFTDSDSSLDLILTVDSNRFQMQIAHLKWTLDLLSAHCNWDNEGITHTWPWKQLRSQLSHYFWSLNKWEAHMQTVVIPTPFTWFGCKYPQIKADSLQLKHILFVSFEIHCGGV